MRNLVNPNPCGVGTSVLLADYRPALLKNRRRGSCGALALLLCAFPALAAERGDNVLARMVPDNSITLIGMRMEQLKSTPLFQKMVAQQKLPQLDDFARESGFDPRRDVRDLLLASNGKLTVLLARGTFHLN